MAGKKGTTMKNRNKGDYAQTLSDRQLMARLRALRPEKYGKNPTINAMKKADITDEELRAALMKHGLSTTILQD